MILVTILFDGHVLVAFHFAVNQHDTGCTRIIGRLEIGEFNFLLMKICPVHLLRIIHLSSALIVKECCQNFIFGR